MPRETPQLSMSQSQTTFSCRECGAQVPATAAQCAGCGCKAPFACQECAKAISAVTLGAKRSHKYPYGAYSREGMPLCADHRITRCHKCSELFPLEMTKRKSIGERADTVLRHGMRPRMEKVYGSFCPDCYSQSRKSTVAAAENDAAPNYRLFAALLVVSLLVLGGVAVLLVASR
ncbi:MAG: hypothetical protein K0Q72_1762 [Armatimonadetes bacterium]|jgi:hypothetical protein|nr:hypothetical protein [Armatimonadota bacterium]